jgi:hypothetical protein
MFPHLNQDVANAISDSIPSTWFRKTRKHDDDGGCNKKYSTNVMGKFKRNNYARTSRGWGSKTVAILIRGHTGSGHNAVVYNQRCQSCNTLGHFTLNEDSYVDQVAYRLKKLAGVSVERPFYESKDDKPHKTEFCEGCKRGLCAKSKDYEFY